MAQDQPTTDYPVTDDGDHDHSAAIQEMGLENVSRVAPSHITDGGAVHAVVGLDLEQGEAYLTDARDISGPTREVYLPDLWRDYKQGRLTHVRPAYLSRGEVVVSRLTLATLADEGYDMLQRQGDTTDDDLEEAVDEAYALLDYDPN